MEQGAVHDTGEAVVVPGESGDVGLDEGRIVQAALGRRPLGPCDSGIGKLQTDDGVAGRGQGEGHFAVPAAGIEHVASERTGSNQVGDHGLGLADVPRRRTLEETVLSIGAVPVHRVNRHEFDGTAVFPQLEPVFGVDLLTLSTRLSPARSPPSPTLTNA